MGEQRQSPVSVVCIDDDALARDALRRLLAEPDIELVGVCASGDECLEVVRTRRPDVALIDMRLNGNSLGGVDLIKQVRRESPTTKCAVLTAATEQDESLVRALMAGTEAYYSKGYALGNGLPTVVRQLAEGDYEIEPEVAKKMAHCMRGTAEWSDVSEQVTQPRFTDRQLEVLDLLADGLKNAAIARELHITVETVKTHKLHIQNALGFSSQAFVVVYAILRRHLALGR